MEIIYADNTQISNRNRLLICISLATIKKKENEKRCFKINDRRKVLDNH